MEIRPDVWLDAERKRRDDILAELIGGIKAQGVDPEQAPAEDLRAIAMSLAIKRQDVDRQTIDTLVQQVVAQAQGYGYLQPFFEDPDVTEIQVVPVLGRPPRVFVEKNGQAEYVGDDVFPDAEAAFLFIKSKADKINKDFSGQMPIADLWLRDRSRVNVQGFEAIPQGGVASTIRKSPAIRPPLPLETMVKNRMMSPFVGRFLVDLLVKGRANFGVFGGMSSGKTALLQALGAYIDPSDRTIIGEPTWELALTNLPNCYNLVEVHHGDEVIVGPYDIIKALFRSNPVRIIWSEFRAGEVVAVFSVFQGQGKGCWTTAHFKDRYGLESRLPKLYQQGGLSLAKSDVHDELYATFKFLVFTEKIERTGARVLSSIVEVTKDGYNTVIELDSRHLRESGKYRWTAPNPPTPEILDFLWKNGADVKDVYKTMSGVVED